MIEIKSTDGRTLYTAQDATSVRAALEEAAKTGANLADADLTRADLTRADLTDANLTGADLTRADLTDANLTGADLTRADLAGADLTRADLTGANLTDADLTRADLTRAYLAGADLADANLAGANLTRAYLARANLTGAEGFNPYHVNPLLILAEQVGPIRAYKLVNQAGQGPQYGGITYELDGSYEVVDADTNPAVDCARGINLATLPWCCAHWQPGYRILVAEFDAADIAAIPNSDGKFRVRRCRIVGEKNLTEIGLVDPAGVTA